MVIRSPTGQNASAHHNVPPAVNEKFQIAKCRVEAPSLCALFLGSAVYCLFHNTFFGLLVHSSACSRQFFVLHM
jgi:hypothetical protein